MILLYIDACLAAIVLVHLAIAYIQTDRLRESLAWLAAARVAAHSTVPVNTIHVLIPVYGEQDTIADSVQFFRSIASRPGVSVHYITTEKEGRQDRSTHAALRNLLSSGTGQPSYIHYPYHTGNKAEQLNYAITQILLHDCTDRRRLYIGIYDVDSQPDVRALDIVLRGTKSAYQQPSADMANYHQLSVFQRAGALLQVKWELCRNLTVLRHNQAMRKPASLQNAVGHGLFIRSDVFEAIGMFRYDIAEDTEFGYRMAFYGFLITPLPYVDFVQYSPSTLANIPQISRWYSAENRLLSYYRATLQQHPAVHQFGRIWRYRGLLFASVHVFFVYTLLGPIVEYILRICNQIMARAYDKDMLDAVTSCHSTTVMSSSS